MRSNENFTFFQHKVYIFGLLSDETGMWGGYSIHWHVYFMYYLDAKKIYIFSPICCMFIGFFFIYILDEVSLFKINIESFVWVFARIIKNYILGR